MDQSDYRLPRHALPRHYSITLRPDLSSATFTGEVDIAVTLVDEATSVTLHAADLAIESALVIDEAGEQAAEPRLDESLERLHLRTRRPMAPGDATIRIAFSGVLNDRLRGFYRATFKDRDGVDQVIATTQFESTDARRAFPCFDEPDMKASFGITLEIADGLDAVSNAGEIARSSEGGITTIRFADTMVMSTYLVAVVVGPLAYTGPARRGATEIRIVHQPGQGHLAAYALDVAAESLRFFEDYYGIAYPGDKLDLVAVPDFAFGAMENLGCVIFRESALLVDPDAATQDELQRVSDVINHELAHMWFGDLVTMRWWNGIWLNEAFATFMEMSATHDQRPDWQRWTFFAAERAQALAIDALGSTRPVEYPVRSPEEAEGMFDLLTYQKGAALVRMLEQHLGEERFRAAIGTYLRAHQYANTETGDLWDAIEEATGEPVRSLMDSWIFQEGYPVIDVAPEGETVTVTQRRFRLDGDHDDTRWQVPLTWAVQAGGSQTVERTVLAERQATLGAGYRPERVMLNVGGHGYYRVRYREPELDALVSAQSSLAPVERYCLLDDLWAFVVAGDETAARFLAVAGRFTDERDVRVWSAIRSGLTRCDAMVDGIARANLHERVSSLVAPARSDLGSRPRPGDTDLQRELRGDLLVDAAVLGRDRAAIDDADDIHSRHVAGEHVDAPLVDAAIRVLAEFGDERRWAEFARRSEDQPTVQARLRYQRALAHFPGDDLIAATVDFAVGESVRSQDAAFVVGAALARRGTHAAAWAATRKNWSRLEQKLPSMLMPRLASGLASVGDPQVAEDAIAFFDDHPMPQAEKTLAQHLDKMRLTVALHEREAARLAAWLA